MLDEDDENMELWYIAGVAGMMGENADYSYAKYHLEHAKEVLEEMKSDFFKENMIGNSSQMNNDDDDQPLVGE